MSSLVCLERLIIRIEIMKNHLQDVDYARCLAVIQQQGPVLAISIAEQIGIFGDHELKRRVVRKMVKHLRDECGERIVGDFLAGYKIADTDKEWQQYLDMRQFGARKTLAVTHRQLKMVTDGRGQGLLFVPGSGQLNNKQFIRSA